MPTLAEQLLLPGDRSECDRRHCGDNVFIKSIEFLNSMITGRTIIACRVKKLSQPPGIKLSRISGEIRASFAYEY